MRWGHWSVQTQKHFPRGRCPQSLLPGEPSLLGAVFSSLCPGSPPLLGNIWLMRAVQAKPESSFPNLPKLQSSEFPPQIGPSNAVLPLPFLAFSSQHEDQWGSPGWFLWVSHPISPLPEQTSAAVALELSPRVSARSQVCPCKDCCQLTRIVAHS